MNAIVNFDFEGHGIRTVMREQMPWFVAADICRALGIANPSDAVKRLDDDEKDTLDLTEGMGSRAVVEVDARAQSIIIVSEAGLYTIVLRSRDAVTPGSVAHRFRKWVTAEVLPALRKDGTYTLAPAHDVTPPRRPRISRRRMVAGMPSRDLRDACELVRTATSLAGRDGGIEAWLEHSGLPRLKAFERLIEHGGRWNGPAALRHLFGLPIGGGPLGELICAAVDDKAKRRDIEEYGVRILDLTEGTAMMVADDHPFLREGFADTDICYAWNDYLRKLPGACRAKKPMMIDERMRRGVLLPKEVWHD